MTPIFLYSLPRSGSTLLQQCLGAHSKIYAHVAEPHVALFEICGRRPQAAVSIYRHLPAATACREFLNTVPAYPRLLGEHLAALYAAATPQGFDFFLDKTPGYHHIAGELVLLMPQAGHLILWRNPLAVLASMIELWGLADVSWLDLYAGPDNLLALREQVSAYRYEDLIADTQTALVAVCAHLGIPFESAMLTGPATTRLLGAVRDPNVDLYSAINTGPLSYWRHTLATPIRRRIALKYLDFLGPARLSIMGYHCASLREALLSTSLSCRHSVKDAKALLRIALARLLPHAWLERRYRGYPPPTGDFKTFLPVKHTPTSP